MTTKNTSHVSHSTSHATEPAPVAAVPAAGIVGAPPAIQLPTPPAEYTTEPPGAFKTVVPRKVEMSAMAAAVSDLRTFADYAQVLGSGAPAQLDVEMAFDVGCKWSSMRQALAKWDAYAAQQEGVAWRLIRNHMGALRPAFELAARANPKLAQKHPGLASVLTARQSIARRGASARMANKKLEEAGLLPTHGAAGKKRKRDAKIAAEATANAQSTGARGPTPNASPGTPVTVPAAPAPNAGMPATGAEPWVVTNGVNGVPSNGGLDGAAHS